MHGTSPDSGPRQISDEGSSAENLQIPELPQINEDGDEGDSSCGDGGEDDGRHDDERCSLG